MGIEPTNTSGLCQRLLGAHAPTGGESGIHSCSTGDQHVRANTSVMEQAGFKFKEVKGSSYKYGGRFQFEGTMLLNHAITAGYKTKIEIGKFKSWDIGPYCTEMFAAKYEIIRGTKNETVFGSKKDDQRKGSARKYEKNNGPWTESNAKKVKDQEKELNELVSQLMERSGAKLEETIKKFHEEVEKSKEKTNAINLKIVSELRVKVEKIKERVQEMELHAGNMERKCQEFERKTKDMKAAVGSALEIKCSENGNYGNLIKMNASVQKFMSDLIKLGE